MDLFSYVLIAITLIGGVLLTYINWAIYRISKDILLVSKDIYRVSEALLEVNVSIYQVTVELLEASKKLEEKI